MPHRCTLPRVQAVGSIFETAESSRKEGLYNRELRLFPWLLCFPICKDSQGTNWNVNRSPGAFFILMG